MTSDHAMRAAKRAGLLVLWALGYVVLGFLGFCVVLGVSLMTAWLLWWAFV